MLSAFTEKRSEAPLCVGLKTDRSSLPSWFMMPSVAHLPFHRKEERMRKISFRLLLSELMQCDAKWCGVDATAWVRSGKWYSRAKDKNGVKIQFLLINELETVCLLFSGKESTVMQRQKAPPFKHRHLRCERHVLFWWFCCQQLSLESRVEVTHHHLMMMHTTVSPER